MKLQNVHVLFRHGDRTPLGELLNDPVPFEKTWPLGRGQLTDEGVLQGFKLGMWLRQKYDFYLKQQYNASDFYMRSTDYDRTLMSAQAVAAGLYPQKSSPLEPYGIQWKPIPVHSVRKDQETLLSLSTCHRLKKLRYGALTAEIVDNFTDSYRSLFNLINSSPVKVKIDRFNLWELVDLFICMRANNVPFPAWCTDEIFQKMREVSNYFWLVMSRNSNEILQLEIGVFLKTFIQRLMVITSGVSTVTINGRQLKSQHTVIYSAHDNHISYILGAFGVKANEEVPYSSAIVFELLGPEPPSPIESYRLRLRYKQGHLDEVGEYRTLEPCAGQLGVDGCPLSLVLEHLEPYFLDEEVYSELCREPSYSNV
ncbi:testicular acid phosphatase homolog [Clonorchis sinensis]|nr:testicular acid phosphatase homolog [Clonorchis sinensis]